MKILIDTHVFLWRMREPERLTRAVTALIEDHENTLLVSPASYLETAIKASLGHLVFPDGFVAFWEAGLVGGGFGVLPFELDHAERLSTLPLHHRDPFDRMLVAQTLVEQVPLVSRDTQLDAYGVDRRW
ncbi:MAG: type II toxin-antitoxin system VapC family toxin [Planctomycetota bacterium]